MSNGSAARNPWTAILLLTALGLAVRGATILVAPNIANADEIFQTVEQGYRILTGHGYVPWEYYYGIRSWIFPGLLAGVIKAAWALGLGSEAAFEIIRFVMAAISLPTIACAYFWGRRSNLPGAALISGGLAALWPDLVYMSPHPLTEVLAAALLIPGLFLAEPAPGTAPGHGRIFLAAFLLAWATMFRVQLAPAALLGWAWAVWPDWRRRLPAAVVGGAVPVLVAVAVDWATWGRPLQSLWLNAIVNSAYGAASTFGTSPWFAYFAKIDIMWGGATAFIVVAALIAVPRARLVAAAAAAIVLSHMLVGHKEYRFIYPAIPLVLTLAGIGSARIVQILSAGLRRDSPSARSRMIALACAVWAVTAGSLFIGREFVDLFRRHAGAIEASFQIARDPDVCGIALWNINWTVWSGEFSLGHAVSVFYPGNDAEFADREPGFNIVLYRKGTSLPGSGWTIESCHPMDAALPRLLAHEEPEFDICVARRPGSCIAEPPLQPRFFLPNELKGKSYPWLDRPLPDDTAPRLTRDRP